jgi:3alpha(or 20beta)-hydroxysteroid dehydrogenase
MAQRLAGKVAIITGAAQGMGAEHARIFASAGAKVVVADISKSLGSAVAEEIGECALFVEHDVTSSGSWTGVVKAAEERFGPVNVLVNNAGIGYAVPLDDLTESEYRRFIDINQVGVFLGIKAVLPSMRRARGGSIVNISSTAGIRGTFTAMAYIASKFAVTGMTKSAAIDLGREGIRVNSVHPGLIRTPMLAATQEYEAAMKDSLPLGRVAEPREVSNLVLFLASDESSYSTGAEFVVDGGLTCKH